jgi:hypothetical protein
MRCDSLVSTAPQGIVELIMLRYRDSDSLYVGMQEAALCALRSQVRSDACQPWQLPASPPRSATVGACLLRSSCLPFGAFPPPSLIL